MTNRETLINDLNSYFDSFCESHNIDLDNQKISTNRFNSIMMYLYDVYVSKLEVTSKKGFKQYSYIDYITLCNWYINKCLYLDIISLYGFCLLINRSMEWLSNLKFIDSKDILNSFIIDIDNINGNSVLEQSSNINSNNSVDCQPVDAERVTILLIDITKKLYQTATQSTVNKLNDTTIGLVTNANNNKDIGLMYAKERIQEQAKARAQISLSDLPLLE